MKNNSSQKGFVVLFTVLIASVILLMGLGIANTASKEMLLSIQSRDAAKAFFAADTGMECALYQDRHLDTFNLLNGNYPSFSCSGNGVYSDTSSSPFTFYVNMGSSSSAGCAKVIVTKPYIDSNENTFSTRIESFGYNTPFDQNYFDCGQIASPNNPNRIERAYRATY